MYVIRTINFIRRLPILIFLRVAKKTDITLVSGVVNFFLHRFDDGAAGGAGEVEAIGETALLSNTEDLPEIMADFRFFHVECTEALYSRCVNDTRWGGGG